MTHSSPPLSDRQLLDRIARAPGRKAGYKQLVRELGLGGGQPRRLLREQLNRLTASGALRTDRGEMWEIPSAADTNPGPAPRDQSTYSSTPTGDEPRQATFHARSATLISGRLDLHRDGFAFVRPAAEGSSVPRGDVLIPQGQLHGAMHGDTVLAEVLREQRDGRRSGQVVRVLTRRNPTLVGVFHYGQFAHGGGSRRPVGRSGRQTDSQAAFTGQNYVQPWDDRLGGFVEIPPGAENVPHGPLLHRTLGELVPQPPPATPLTADAAAREDLWPLEGKVVEVELTRFPQPGRPGVGRLLEVLGDPDAFGVDVEIIIRKHALPHTFPAHVLAEAEERARLTNATLEASEVELLEDFRGLPVITIDGETARDFDDAVLVRQLANGHTELQVHIADVSRYVLPASLLDTEARLRGTSVYFPDRAVPMLPHALSSGICSLRPDEDRLVLSCVMEIDSAGEIRGYRLAEGVIRSARRLTYTGVQQCLNASPGAAEWNQPRVITPAATAEDIAERARMEAEFPEIAAGLDRMLTLALQLHAKRTRRGSIDFDLPEPVIAFDPQGNMQAILRSERGWAHRLIEEFMLSANECVATWLRAQAIPSIYRIHELPDPKRIVEFEETAAAFGETLGVGALPTRRLSFKSDHRVPARGGGRGAGRTSGRAASPRNGRTVTTSFDIPEHIPVTPQMYQRLIRRIAGKPQERILSYLMLRSLKQARYAERNEGHFALASPCYTHFTSPIRRYPDLVVHRLLRTMLRRGADPNGGSILSTDALPWRAGKGAVRAPLPPRVRDVASEPLPFHTRSGSHHSAPEKKGRIGWASTPGSANDPEQASSRSAHVEIGHEPLSAEELAAIALESSQAERRAADAERELIDWKKMKFMADRIGDHFQGIILSVTKFGFFVELDSLFVEGLVPIGSLAGDTYLFRDADRTICGTRSGHCFRVGDAVEVFLDRIDRQQHRLQFALVPGTEPAGPRSLRRRSDKPKDAEVSSGAAPRPGKPGRLPKPESGKLKHKKKKKKR